MTDEERNIRVNYIRPFYMPVDGKPLLETNLNYVADIKKSVEERGYTIGKAGVFAQSDSHGIICHTLLNALSFYPWLRLLWQAA